jgi:hypothetical protein|tara:strand:- start:24 stop:221 length:198 start_codon:yes stop_codon:yes gene_type:complete
MTRTQRDNLNEWLDSRKEATGDAWAESIKVFNALGAAEQQYIITNRWYRAQDGQRIDRALTPQAK